MQRQILLLPDHDDALVFRADSREYGLPSPATLAKWACRPSESPIQLPYTLVGRRVAYRVGDLRRLRDALTFQHSADRAAKRLRRDAKSSEGTVE